MTDSTDNARGPERGMVWLYKMADEYENPTRWTPPENPDEYEEYIRADLAPDPLGAVKVKPLEWGYHPAGAIAAPPTGFAYIIDTRMKDRVYSLKGFNPQREFSSMDEAKAAAQADYEARIRSALEPCDPLADPRVMALVEALRQIADMKPHHAGQTPNEYHMQKDARAALAALSPTGGNADG